MIKQACYPGIFVILCLLAILPNARASTVVYNLADDWSDVSNPNGVWSLNGEDGSAITTHFADYAPTSNIFGSAQPAWAIAPYPEVGHVPFWFKRSSDSTVYDVPLGVVGMHGGAAPAQVGVTWTSPVDGSADISGSVWQALKSGVHLERNADWRIRLNNTVLTGGNLSATDPYTSATPLDLAAGSGGALVLAGLAVSVGDVIALEFISPDTGSTLNGLDLTIAASVVPVPAAVWLFGTAMLTLLGFIARAKRLD